LDNWQSLNSVSTDVSNIIIGYMSTFIQGIIAFAETMQNVFALFG